MAQFNFLNLSHFRYSRWNENNEKVSLWCCMLLEWVLYYFQWTRLMGQFIEFHSFLCGTMRKFLARFLVCINFFFCNKSHRIFFYWTQIYQNLVTKQKYTAIDSIDIYCQFVTLKKYLHTIQFFSIETTKNYILKSKALENKLRILIPSCISSVKHLISAIHWYK